MKKIATTTVALLFVAGLAMFAQAERSKLYIDGKMEILGAREANTGVAGGALGANGYYSRVEEMVQLNVSADLSDNVSTTLSLEQYGTWGLGGDTVNANALSARQSDVRIDQAYVTLKEAFVKMLTLQVGVQDVLYSLKDDEMFVAFPELGALKASFDFSQGAAKTPLLLDVVLGTLDENGDAKDTGLVLLAGQYFVKSGKKDIAKVLVSLLYLSDPDEDAAGEEDKSLFQYTLGVDYQITDDIDAYLEIAGQSGNYNHMDTGNVAFNLGGSYTFNKVKGKPYVGLEFLLLPGDDQDNSWINLGDNDGSLVLEANRDLRDVNYAGEGLAKLLTTNYQAIKVKGGVDVDIAATKKTLKVAGQVAMFQRDEDAVATDNFAANTDDAIGIEVDVQLSYPLTEDAVLGGYLGWLMADDAIKDTSGSDDDVIVAGLKLSVSF